MIDPIDSLNGLLMLAHDLVHAFALAEERVRSPALARSLAAMRLENQRQLSDLTAMVLRLGGRPKGRRDLRGSLLGGTTSFSVFLGDDAVVRALARAEELAARSCDEALDCGLPAEAKELVRTGHAQHTVRLARLRALAVRPEPHDIHGG